MLMLVVMLKAKTIIKLFRLVLLQTHTRGGRHSSSSKLSERSGWRTRKSKKRGRGSDKKFHL
jgi:hypothetical protein